MNTGRQQKGVLMRRGLLIGILWIVHLLFLRPFSWGEWKPKPPMPTPRHGVCSAVLNGQIYVIGGKGRHGGYLAIVERYSPATDTWDTDVAPLLEARSHAAAVALNGKIYVMGGRYRNKVLKSVEVYDPVQNRWQRVQNMHEAREALAAVVLDGKIYAIGGFGKDDHHGQQEYEDDIEYYDPAEDSWEELSSKLLYPRASMGAVTLRDSIFVPGGLYYGPIGLMERYHPSRGWELRKSLQIARSGFAAVALGDSLFVIGGKGLRGMLRSVEVYDLRTETWSFVDSLSTPRMDLTAQVVDGKIYAIGGKMGHAMQVTDRVEVLELSSTPVTPVEVPAPSSFELLAGYPNPFRRETHIAFSVRLPFPPSGRDATSFVSLQIYDLQGRYVRTLFRGVPQQEQYLFTWDGTDEAGRVVPSGVYFCILRAKGQRQIQKITFLK